MKVGCFLTWRETKWQWDRENPARWRTGSSKPRCVRRGRIEELHALHLAMMHGRAEFCPSNPCWRLANERTQQTGLFPCVGAHNDNDPLTGIYYSSVYSPRLAYISFDRFAGGHDWRAVDEQFVTAKALGGNSSSAPVKSAKLTSTNGSDGQPTSQRSLNRVQDRDRSLLWRGNWASRSTSLPPASFVI